MRVHEKSEEHLQKVLPAQWVNIFVHIGNRNNEQVSNALELQSALSTRIHLFRKISCKIFVASSVQKSEK